MPSDCGHEAIGGDKGFTKAVDKEAGKLFQPGGIATITRKIA